MMNEAGRLAFLPHHSQTSRGSARSREANSFYAYGINNQSIPDLDGAEWLVNCKEGRKLFYKSPPQKHTYFYKHTHNPSAC